MELSSRQVFALVIGVGIVGTGLLVSVLARADLGTLGTVVWVAGYGTTVLVLWWGWLRPLDLGHDPPGPDSGSG